MPLLMAVMVLCCSREKIVINRFIYIIISYIEAFEGSKASIYLEKFLPDKTHWDIIALLTDKILRLLRHAK